MEKQPVHKCRLQRTGLDSSPKHPTRMCLIHLTRRWMNSPNATRSQASQAAKGGDVRVSR